MSEREEASLRAVREGMSAHRLALSHAEWAALSQFGGVELPAGLTESGADRPVDEGARRTGAASLVERGVLTADGDGGFAAVPSVAANLALLVQRSIALRVEVGIGQRGLVATYAVGDPLAASLVTAPDDGVELSLFESIDLGRELARAVPDQSGVDGVTNRIRQALGGGESVPLVGALPMAALSDPQPSTWDELDEGQARLARAAAAQTVGVLRCLVAGPAADGVGVGQVVWLATEAGWVGLSPQPPVDGEATVRLEPVDRTDLGVWVAPLIARLLDTASVST
jgi:hypothetical protein